MKTKWVAHYTGSETWNPSGNGNGWYVTRSMDDKRITFIRWSRRGVYLCIWKGYMNFLRMQNFNWGMEITATVYKFRLSVGVAMPERFNPLWWRLNPNSKVTNTPLVCRRA